MGPGFESLKVHQKVSVTSVEGPPVPIPNTEVKLNCAENTWLATARKNRSMLTRSERTDRMGNSNEFPIFTLMIFLLSSIGRALTGSFRGAKGSEDRNEVSTLP